MRLQVLIVSALIAIGAHAAVLETGTLRFSYPDDYVQQPNSASVLLVGPSGQRVRLSSISFRGAESEAPAWLEKVNKGVHGLVIREATSHGLQISSAEQPVFLPSGASGLTVSSFNSESGLSFIQYVLSRYKTNVYLTLEAHEPAIQAEAEARELAQGIEWK